MVRRFVSAIVLMTGLWSAGWIGGTEVLAAPQDSTRSTLFALTGKDASGNWLVLRFGVSPHATYGYDRALREFPMPPSPPHPIFDFRFMDLPGQPRIPPTGSYADVRRWPSPALLDTFVVRFQPMNDVYPMHITFDEGVQCCVDSLVLIVDQSTRVLHGAALTETIALNGPADRFVFIVRWKPMELLNRSPLDGGIRR